MRLTFPQQWLFALALSLILVGCGGGAPAEQPAATEPAEGEAAVSAPEDTGNGAGDTGAANEGQSTETGAAATEAPTPTPQPVVVVTSVPPAVDSETIEASVEPDATVLAIYDSLIPQIEEEIGGAFWFALSGNQIRGWLFQFYDENADEILSYNVNEDGSISQLPTRQPDDIEMEDIRALTRDTIIVDSDQALEIAVDQGVVVDDAAAPPLYFLRPSPDDVPQWMIVSTATTGSVTIDATDGSVIQ